MTSSTINALKGTKLLRNQQQSRPNGKLECGPIQRVPPIFGRATTLGIGPLPNVVALPNIGGALCSTPQSPADAQY